MKIFILLAALLGAGCGQPENHDVQVIVGATLLDEAGKPAIDYSVVVVRDGKIEAAGSQVQIPVPRDSAKVNGIGKFLVSDPPGTRLQAGQPANLLLLGVNPSTDAQYQAKIEKRMVGGRWTEASH